MDTVKSRFVTLEQAENVVGDLRQSDLVKGKIGEGSKPSPTTAVSEFFVEGELYFRLVTTYYYVNKKLQLLVAETKDHNNNTLEFTEKLWEYDSKIDLYNHEKHINNELTFRELQKEGYGKPNDIAEFTDANRTDGDIEAQDDGNAAAACFLENPPSGIEPCCLFSGITYNYCGAYCGVLQSAGGERPVNNCDYCCYDHDNCLLSNSDPCPCHEDLLNCLGNHSCPGDTTMGIGIRVRATSDGCYF
ncbi:hypothetical protein [Gracilibacillus salinarum]|uniref:Phospholipase A2 domain-containing protein n=1 Tax=Gracilibacillus salinarum TaxID=2932255 RepID=A0ABY4GIZ5_9BACI|nr:hypothetical protein [Gracilibacillus salinarum]UOQ84325.1 hypothetical protein MUN87_16750 [Gracilibacillus salinarum]